VTIPTAVAVPKFPGSLEEAQEYIGQKNLTSQHTIYYIGATRDL